MVNSMSAFNGAYYAKDGTIRNIDGKEGNGKPEFSPFCGTFYDSEGNIRDIGDLLQELANGGNNSGGEVIDENGEKVTLPNAALLAKIGVKDGVLTFEDEPITGVLGTF